MKYCKLNVHTLFLIGNLDTQSDRYEPDLNGFNPGDARDTSTPKTLATIIRAFALSDLLPDDKRTLFTDWL